MDKNLKNLCVGFEALDEPIFILNDKGQIIFQNSEAKKAFGFVAAGGHYTSCLRSPIIANIIRDGVKKKTIVVAEYFHKTITERWFSARISPLNDLDVKQGSDYFLLGFRDQTKAKLMDRMRSDFIANASHELRTPLASLTGFIETIQGPAKDDVPAREKFLKIMLEQSSRMARLLDDLLSLSRLEMRGHLVPSEEVDLNYLLGEVCASLATAAKIEGVELNLILPKKELLVKGDHDELFQVFENLIENAFKYGVEGQKVDIILKKDTLKDVFTGKNISIASFSSPIYVEVRDYGSGIAKEHLPRLTERFYRVNVSKSRSKKGTGLGLAIVKHILARHNANLIVRSKLGSGSQFITVFDKANNDI